MFIPYLGEPGQTVAPGETMASFGQGSNPQFDTPAGQQPPYWQDATDQADWVLGQVGPGLQGSTALAVNEGVIVASNGRMFQANGKDFPMAAAILFEFDGTTGDQRALISQGSFRLRINTGTSPHDLGGSSQAIAACVYDNELTLVMVWASRANDEGRDYDVACFNLDAHPEVREIVGNADLLGDANLTDELLIGAHSANDPAVGLTVYGAWFWSGVGTTLIAEYENVWWTPEKAEKFAEDPFGMYRRAAIAQSGPITNIGTRQLGSNTNGGDVTLTFDGSPQEDDLVIVIGGHSNDGDDTIGITTAGYTAINEIDRGTSALKGGIFYKFMGASPDASVDCDGSNHAQDGVTYSSIVLRGVDKTTPFDVAVVETIGSGNDPDIDGVTTITNEAWVVVGMMTGFENTTTGYPTGYVNTGSIGGADTHGVSVSICTKEVVVAGVENPSAFTHDVAFSLHAGWTIAIRPDQGAAPPTDTILPHFASMIGV
jgi:hypothetical protein